MAHPWIHLLQGYVSLFCCLRHSAVGDLTSLTQAVLRESWGHPEGPPAPTQMWWSSGAGCEKHIFIIYTLQAGGPPLRSILLTVSLKMNVLFGLNLIWGNFSLYILRD